MSAPLVLTVTDAETARGIVAAGPPYPVLISISDTPSPTRAADTTWTKACSDRLCLQFDDVLRPVQGYVPATMAQVHELIAFARSPRRPEPWLVHCGAGVSRSVAAALLVRVAQQRGSPAYTNLVLSLNGLRFLVMQYALSALNDDLRESELAGYREVGMGRPNALMLSLGDRAMGFDGKLVRAALTVWPQILADVEMVQGAL